jgi:hypothetical protein
LQPATLALAVALTLAACERRAVPTRRTPPVALAIRLGADSSRTERLEVTPPRARVWMSRVSSVRPLSLELPSPDAAPAAPEPEPPAPPPSFDLSAELKPPLLRSAEPLRVPRGSRRASVELDVRVDEDGAVSDALRAGGVTDSTLVAAAVNCALAMRFYPALQSGRPVAVWCRQRFDFLGR